MSYAIGPGQNVPDCPLLLTGHQQTSLVALRGQPLVVYFYPKASTPGCTQEGHDFAEAFASFQQCGVRILGASRDSLKAQEQFKAKQHFPFDLVADTEQRLCNTFDVIHLKKLYGKESLGLERSTFLLDASGLLRREWRKIKVAGHVAKVLEAAREL